MKTEKLLIVGAIIGGLILMAKAPIQSVLEKMAKAIEYWESGGNPDALSFQNNNPGNLRWFDPDNIPWSGAMGLDSQSHVIFDSYASGWAALLYQLTLAFMGRSGVYKPTDTLTQFFRKYAEANPENYASYVAGQLGVSPDTQLQNITSA